MVFSDQQQKELNETPGLSWREILKQGAPVGTAARAAPEVSIIFPCLNEADSVEDCIREADRALSNAGISGEIIVADNGSDDGSRSLADAAGATVVNVRRRGYGSAIMAGFREASGAFLIMCDADSTYDLSSLAALVGEWRAGNDLVMGNRFAGQMELGAMPWSHRVIGNPILSGLTRLFFGTHITDTHCGLRGISTEAYHQLELRSPSMEFATEMVAGAARMGLRTAEVPVTYRLRAGTSKLRTIRDGARHLRFMFQLLLSSRWTLRSPVWNESLRHPENSYLAATESRRQRPPKT